MKKYISYPGTLKIKYTFQQQTLPVKGESSPSTTNLKIFEYKNIIYFMVTPLQLTRSQQLRIFANTFFCLSFVALDPGAVLSSLFLHGLEVILFV